MKAKMLVPCCSEPNDRLMGAGYGFVSKTDEASYQARDP